MLCNCLIWLIKMSSPQSILCWWFPAKSNRKGNHVSDGEFTYLKCWRQNRTLHPNNQHTHTYHTNKHIFTIFHELRNICTVHGNKKKLSVSREESHLKCTASSDSFICIERGADVFAEKLGDSLFDSWASCGSSNYLHSIDIIPAQLCHKTHKMDWVESPFI